MAGHVLRYLPCSHCLDSRVSNTCLSDKKMVEDRTPKRYICYKNQCESVYNSVRIATLHDDHKGQCWATMCKCEQYCKWECCKGTMVQQDVVSPWPPGWALQQRVWWGWLTHCWRRWGSRSPLLSWARRVLSLRTFCRYSCLGLAKQGNKLEGNIVYICK